MADLFGLTPTGFVPKSTDQVRTDSETRIRNRFGKSLPLGDKTLLGQLIGVVSDAAGSLWSAGEQIYAAFDPDKALDEALDAVSKITGTFRPQAVASFVDEIITGDPGTVVAAGWNVATASTGIIFASVADITLVAVSAWLPTTNYAEGDQVSNGGNVYQCIAPGTSAGSGGPAGTAEDITDGTVHWAFCGPGTASASVVCQAIDAGPQVAVAFDLTDIRTPLGGVTGATNLNDAIIGVAVGTNEQLRILREEELGSSGNSPVDAIRAKLLNVVGVTAATVFYNPTDTTDGNGLPPHSVLALVQGGADQDIYNALWASVAAGINTDGTSVGTVTDSQGNPQTLRFERPTLVPIYERITVTYDATKYGGDAAVQLDVATFGEGLPSGKDVVPSSFVAAAFGVAGVLDAAALVYADIIGAPAAWLPTHGYVATPGSRSVVTNDGGRAYICITSGTSAGSGGPTGTGTDIVDGTAHWYFLGNTIPIDSFHLATYDTSRVVVVSTPGTP